MSAQKFVTICGKRWRLKRPTTKMVDEEGDELLGNCDPPNTKGKAIRLAASAKGEDELTTLVHEVLHAAAYALLAEKYVEDTSAHLGDFLWKHGYRKSDTCSHKDRGKKQLILNIHGILKASAYHVFDEDYVEGLSGDLGTILWRFGYRKVELNESADE